MQGWGADRLLDVSPHPPGIFLPCGFLEFLTYGDR